MCKVLSPKTARTWGISSAAFLILPSASKEALLPTIKSTVPKSKIKAKTAILDCEAIGFNPVSNEFLPFQETVQRKRKYDIAAKALEIPLRLFTFELLYKDGVNHLHNPFSHRRKILKETVRETGDLLKDIITIAPEEISNDPKQIELMFDDAITRGLEGIIAKKLDGVYQPGARGWNWIKFKRSYSSKIEDTIDCLVMGYDAGKGKRTGFGIGAFLVGVYDGKRDQFVTVCKIGTGLTDLEWKELKKRCGKVKSEKMPMLYDVDTMMDVDAWVKPGIVVEIKSDEITRSPVHTAGRIMQPSKTGKGQEVKVAGYALRFPRLEKFRDDKRSEDVTTLKELESLFRSMNK